MSASSPKKPLNILYHHRTQGRGAEGVHIASIVNALENLGHVVTVLSPPGVDPLSTAGNAPVDKSNVKTSGIHSVWKIISKQLPNFAFEIIEICYNIPALWRLKKALAAVQYDLIYERYAFFMIAGGLISRWYRIPLVLEANEVSGIKNRARRQTFEKTCSFFEQILFTRCTKILTVSSYLKAMIIENGVNPDRIKVVPNAIDLEKFNRQIEISDLLSKYGLKDKIVIGFAGWFDEWDRLDLLIDAFRDLHQQYSQLVLLLIGDGTVLDGVRAKINKYGLSDFIIMTGAVDRKEITNYLSLLDIAVITHSNEFGSPVVMFEFMGLKIPVVAPKLMPITDVLRHDKTALLFDVLEMGQLKACITELIEDKNYRSQLAEDAYQVLVKEHTWEDNAKIIVTESGL